MQIGEQNLALAQLFALAGLGSLTFTTISALAKIWPGPSDSRAPAAS